MTKLFKRVVKEVEKLPAGEQDAVASLVLEELRVETGWSERFSDKAKLGRLVAAARDEYRAGRTEELDPDKL